MVADTQERTQAPIRQVSPAQARRGQTGSTLIEVLIALLLLSVGLMGMAALHARAIQYSVDGQDRTRAAQLAGEMVSSMWSARSNTPAPTVIAAWQSRVSDPSGSGLPNGAGTVAAPDANGVVTITITWRPPNRTTTDGNYKYVTRVALP